MKRDERKEIKDETTGAAATIENAYYGFDVCFGRYDREGHFNVSCFKSSKIYKTQSGAEKGASRWLADNR